jgi:hypothetical protein
MITLLGRTFYAPGERARLRIAELTQHLLEARTLCDDRAFEIGVMKDRVGHLTTALWLEQAAGFRSADGTNPVIAEESIMSYRCVRSEQRVPRGMFTLEADIEIAYAGNVQELAEATYVECRGIAWKLVGMNVQRKWADEMLRKKRPSPEPRYNTLSLSLVATADPRSAGPPHP